MPSLLSSTSVVREEPSGEWSSTETGSPPGTKTISKLIDDYDYDDYDDYDDDDDDNGDDDNGGGGDDDDDFAKHR